MDTADFSFLELPSLFTSLASFSYPSPRSFSGIFLPLFLKVLFRICPRTFSHTGAARSPGALPEQAVLSTPVFCIAHALYLSGVPAPLIHLPRLHVSFGIVKKSFGFPILTLSETGLLCMSPSPKILSRTLT